MIITKDERKRVWKQHLKKLFHDLRTEPIFPEKITAAIKQIRDGQALGLDEIPTELLKLLNRNNIWHI